MAQVNIRNLDPDVYARLQETAEAEGVSVAEIARRALTAGPDVTRTAVRADQEMIKAGIPKWSRDKVLKVITGTTSSAGVPRIQASA